MANLMIWEVLDLVSKAASKKEKIKILQMNNSLGLRDVLKASFDDRVQFMLPEGVPPFEKATEKFLHLDKVTKNMGLYLKHNEGRVNKAKVEMLFIRSLETIDPKDAIVLCQMKDKTLGAAYKGLTKKLVQEAFPGLIRD